MGVEQIRNVIYYQSYKYHYPWFGWCTLPAGRILGSLLTLHACRVQGGWPGPAATRIFSTARGCATSKPFGWDKGTYDLPGLCFKPQYYRGYIGTQRALPIWCREPSLPFQQENTLTGHHVSSHMTAWLWRHPEWERERAEMEVLGGLGWRADL